MSLSQRLRKDERDLDMDEENWFNDDADENKITSLNHGTLFNDGSDDEDSQPENASAISTSEPPKSHHSLSDNDDDDDELSAPSRSNYHKPTINIHIGRSSMASSSDLPVDGSSATSSQMIEPASPYAMVKTENFRKQKLISFCSCFSQSPALSSIADQYNDDDEDEDEDDDNDEEEENNSDSYSTMRKRKLENNNHERNKVFKKISDQS